MKVKYIFVLIWMLPGVINLAYSKGPAPQKMAWHSYSNSIKFNKKFTFNTEIHERHFWSPLAQHQFAYRFSLQKTLDRKGDLSFAPGLALFQHATPQDPDREFVLFIPEVRPQLDFNHRQKFDRITFQHRYRLETRFFHKVAPSKKVLDPGYEFNSFKVRYQFMASVPVISFNEDQKLQFRFGDELHVHFGKKTKKNYFDHNRFFGSVMVDVIPSLALEVGYQHWYHQVAEGENIHRHFLRLGLLQTFSLKSKSN